MGTNYYIKGYDEKDENGNFLYTIDDPKFHLGKRSAAGLYCFDCNVTLHKGGIEQVHKGGEWYKKCPSCGKAPQKENLKNSTAGIELGFNKNQTEKRTGVRSCSSFTSVLVCRLSLSEKIIGPNFSPSQKLVVDEYGREYTCKEFIQIVKACPIQFFVINDYFC